MKVNKILISNLKNNKILLK